MLSDGMAGMRNGNCFSFYIVSEKGNKKKKKKATVLVSLPSA